jgi:hypothetical protein
MSEGITEGFGGQGAGQVGKQVAGRVGGAGGQGPTWETLDEWVLMKAQELLCGLSGGDPTDDLVKAWLDFLLSPPGGEKP